MRPTPAWTMTIIITTFSFAYRLPFCSYFTRSCYLNTDEKKKRHTSVSMANDFQTIKGMIYLQRACSCNKQYYLRHNLLSSPLNVLNHRSIRKHFANRNKATFFVKIRQELWRLCLLIVESNLFYILLENINNDGGCRYALSFGFEWLKTSYGTSITLSYVERLDSEGWDSDYWEITTPIIVEGEILYARKTWAVFVDSRHRTAMVCLCAETHWYSL